MTSGQVADYLKECNVLSDLLAHFAEADWVRPTAFKGWTANDIVAHLYFWDKAADLAFRDREAVTILLDEVIRAVDVEGLRAYENRAISEHGPALLDAWCAHYRDATARWQRLDPALRAKWGGPDMSVRSLISARQMEVWAHGQALFDMAGQDRPESERLRNIVVLGVNTFGWSFAVRGQTPPADPPNITLVSPGGAAWNFNQGATHSSVRGSAVEFCQVVTQTRNLADTSLDVRGEAARAWLEHAQCFAGRSETPPAPGTRRKGAPESGA